MPYRIQGLNPYIVPEPLPINGMVYVPLEDLTETLGGAAEWDLEKGICVVQIGRWQARVRIGDTRATVNDEEVTLAGPLVERNGSLWAPLTFFHTAFGFRVNAEGDSVSITNPAADCDEPSDAAPAAPTMAPGLADA